MSRPRQKGTEPEWQSDHDVARLSPFWRSWLLDPNSLTERLVEASSQDFELQLLRQQTGTAYPSEEQALGLEPGQSTLVREVLLYGQGEPWVFGRTVASLQSVSGPLRYLADLGTAALGTVIFREPSLVRGPIEVACISPTSTCRFLPEHLTRCSALWGRRSIITVHGANLLVSEVFLNRFPGGY